MKWNEKSLRNAWKLLLFQNILREDCGKHMLFYSPYLYFLDILTYLHDKYDKSESFDTVLFYHWVA